MEQRLTSIFPVSYRWNLLLTVTVISATFCSAKEICPYRICKTCEVKYLTCPVKCCLTIYKRFVCCGGSNNKTNTNQGIDNDINDDHYNHDIFHEQDSADYRSLNDFSDHLHIVIGAGSAAALLVLLTCTVCLVHAYTKRIRGHGPNSERQQRRRSRQEPSISQCSMEMYSVGKPPPYSEYPPSYSQVVSTGNTDHNRNDDAHNSETFCEIIRPPSPLPPPYNEISETLPTQGDISQQRF
ncbi:hypothetical protein ACJMK2_043821 [Sinanodonta woodiana]|uniref:Uncharacterized protein n=1 Tax=Sinanodonta woodiana TaxID=1069815 RepID=A0ABD3W0W6_SINWO